jgi:hypothetical protein
MWRPKLAHACMLRRLGHARKYVAQRLDRGLAHDGETNHSLKLLQVFKQLICVGWINDYLDLCMLYFPSGLRMFGRTYARTI